MRERMFEKHHRARGTLAHPGRSRAPLWLLPLMLVVGCAPLQREPAAAPVDTADPNAVTQVIPASDELVAAPLRSTVLEDNEELRELLTTALAEKRVLESTLEQTAAQTAQLTAEVERQRQELARVTAQLDAETQRARALDADLHKNISERRTIAEMYAAEKHQRLMFEKELLEREIASRTIVTRKDP